MPMFDWMIVGAGFAGSVLAERLASQRNEKVLVIEKRDHIAGDAFDERNADGIMIHKYGPHIFHTNADSILEYLSQFTAWRPYVHRVLAKVDGQLLPIPINLDTVNKLYGLSLNSEQLEKFFASKAEHKDEILTSEDVVVSKVGRDLYEKFFRGYTRKQWGLDPSELDKSVTSRVPTRTNKDDRYFEDKHQCMPALGYTRMFNRMIDHPNITVETGKNFADMRSRVKYNRLIFTGPVDEYFDYCYGKLPYRSLRFVHETLNKPWHQSVAVINYPQTEDYTRITEYKHLTGQAHTKTSLTYEYPSDKGDPFYPIPRPENQAMYKQYEKIANLTQDVWFAGRLATYRYYNMDQIVGQALATFNRIDEQLPRREITRVQTSMPAELSAAIN